MTAPAHHKDKNCYNLIWVLEVYSDEAELWQIMESYGDENKALKDKYEYSKRFFDEGVYDVRTRLSTFRRTYD
jgi:hypothetical protein